MDNWQLPLVVMIVLAAGFYLARRVWLGLSGRKAGGCGGGCGCASAARAPQAKGTFIPDGQLTLRRRGE